MAVGPTPLVHEEPSRKGLVAGLAVVVIVLGAFALVQSRSGKLDTMTAVDARLALGAERGEAVSEVEKNRSSELYYRVVLSGVPLGWRLHLRCEWVSPGG